MLICELLLASVDYGTDQKIQNTIAHEFRDRTILCIARTLIFFRIRCHLAKFSRTDRLRTIIGYDRICIFDAGQISVSLCTVMVEMDVNDKNQEFDTPTRLYNNAAGIFRTMCDRSSITLDDLKAAGKASRDV